MVYASTRVVLIYKKTYQVFNIQIFQYDLFDVYPHNIETLSDIY